MRAVGALLRAGETLMAPFVTRLNELTEGPTRYARWKGFPSVAALIAHETRLSHSHAHALVALGQVMTREIPVVPEPEGLDFKAVPDAGLATVPAPPRPAVPVVELSPLAKAARDRTLGTEVIRIIAAAVEATTVNAGEAEVVLVA